VAEGRIRDALYGSWASLVCWFWTAQTLPSSAPSPAGRASPPLLVVGKTTQFRARCELDVSATTISKSPSLSREVTVTNKLGVHARPSSQFVRLAGTFTCDVWVEKDGETINGKSIMGLLMLAAGPGSILKITCAGEGADSALEKLVTLIDAKFGEE